MPLVKTPAFEGPLDLLLHLIRANQVDIYDIPIAEITQQYLSYMEFFESLDLAIAGEYVLIAATLIEIKSRLLLPQAPPSSPDEEAEDPAPNWWRNCWNISRFRERWKPCAAGRRCGG